jgi:crossover junction endodeoxyribonuclease RuvC
MRVLGIDCGTEKTGYGVIDTDGRRHTLVVAGVVVTSPKEPMHLRLLAIARALRELVQKHAPEAAAVEDVFYAANVKTSLKLAQVRGVALLTVAEAGLDLKEYSALEIKMSVVGYGRAEKQQVQMMVRSLLHLDEDVKSPDAADALAAAICYATHRALEAVR